MKSFLTQPRLQCIILSSLILLFLEGVTSQTIVINKYAGPGEVSIGTRFNFTGTVTSPTPGSFPTGVTFSVKNKNSASYTQICNVDFSVCSEHINRPCFCSKTAGDIYHFVIQVTATSERSEAEISGNVGNPQKYPKVTKVTVPPTAGTSTGSTDVTNDNVTLTTVTTGVGGESVSPTVTVSTTPQIDTTDGPTTETTPDEDDNDHALEIGLGVAGVIVVVVICVVVGVMISKKKKESASVKTDADDPHATSATSATPATTIELDTTGKNSSATSQ